MSRCPDVPPVPPKMNPKSMWMTCPSVSIKILALCLSFTYVIRNHSNISKKTVKIESIDSSSEDTKVEVEVKVEVKVKDSECRRK